MAKIKPVSINTDAAPEVKTVTLFTIDGVEYQVPEKVRPNISLAYLRDVSDNGQEYALAKAMRALLGEEAMNALADCDAVGDEEMGRIMDIVTELLFSSMKGLAGKSRGGQRK